MKQDDAYPVGDGKRGEKGRIGYLLRQAQVAMRHTLDQALGDVGLTLPQFSALTMVNAYESPSSAEIARLSMLSPQTVNLVVRNLESRGLIRRTRHPQHGRILCLSMTEAGKAVLVQARGIVRPLERSMTEGLSREDEAVIRQWLVSVARHFSNP